MRIVHVLFNMTIGGTETLLVDIMNRQARDGHDVALLLINDRHDGALLSTVSPEVDVHVLGKPQGTRNPLWLLKFNNALRRLRPDVVHVHNERALGMIYGPRRFPIGFTYHGLGYTNPWHGRPDRQFAVSQAVADDVSSRGLGEASVVVNGIDTDAIARRRNAEPAKPLRMVQVGRLDHKTKGQDLTLQALALLGADVDATLDFIGDGPSADHLRRLAAELGVDSRVRFVGSLSRKEVYSRLADYDVALMTSRSEGFGLTLAEAAAAGVPIITCDLPGPLEVVDGGRLATVFHAGSADALADAIRRVAADYPAAATMTGMAAEFAASNFSIQATARHYIEHYRQMIANKK